jgi:hypothetical protein
MEPIHLSEEEIEAVFLAGPKALMKHSEEKAHLHLVHDGCPVCNEKVIARALAEFFVIPPTA